MVTLKVGKTVIIFARIRLVANYMIHKANCFFLEDRQLLPEGIYSNIFRVISMQLNLPLKYERLSDDVEIGTYERQMPWGGYHKIKFICKDGIPVSLPFETIETIGNGYHVRFGSYEGTLDKQGRLVSELSFDYNADTIRGIADDLMEAYLEQARENLRADLTEKNSPLDTFISNARIRAGYEHGMS